MDDQSTAERLAVLNSHAVLDTPPEPQFDDIVALARKLCDAPIALVSFVECERQWFKAKLGVDMSETPIEQSVCAIAIEEPRFLVIPDLTADARTRKNALVTGGPQIRFYAGAVLRASEGVALGTLCVIDTIPRPEGLTADQLDCLLRLASQTMALLELRRAVNNRDYALVQEQRAGYDRRIVIKELSHRLKNTLAMVQAIASETLRSTVDKEALRKFSRRITTLGEAHDVLLEQNWLEAQLIAVIEGAIAAHGTRDRYDIVGPELSLDAKAALSVSLIIHELATNAVKHGALSNGEGRIKIRWEIVGSVDEAELTLRWEEIGGPSIGQPLTSGFGTRLVSMGLSGTGSSELRYPPSGLVAEFKAPLSSLSPGADPNEGI